MKNKTTKKYKWTPKKKEFQKPYNPCKEYLV